MVQNVVLMACGSFSPPTPMHFRMFEIARDYFAQMGSSKVLGGIMSPVHDSYNKQGLVTCSHRLNMLRLGLQSSDWIRVSEWETRQSGWTKTRVALQYHQNYINSFLNDGLNGDVTDSELSNWVPNLEKSSGPVQLKLLCGADLLESFSVPNLWDPDDLEAILGQHGLVVITRSGSNPEQFIFNSDMLSRHRRNITLITNWVANEVSSTMIRRLLSRGQSVKYLLDDRLIDYIKHNHLFGSHDKSKFILTPPKDKLYTNGGDGIVLKLNKINQSHSPAASPDEIMMDETDHRQPKHLLETEKPLKPKVFCCGDSNKRASRASRRGPGQAVQILNNGPKRQSSVDSSEVEVGKANGICIISAPNLSASSSTITNATAQEILSGTDAARNYNDMIKFVFTEHGIKVISDKEYVV